LSEATEKYHVASLFIFIISLLSWGEKGGAGLFFLRFSQFGYRAVRNTGSLAVLNAGRLFAAFRSFGAKVAKAGGKNSKIHVDFIRAGRNNFLNFNAAHSLTVVVLLFTGNFTGMAAGAPVVLYQQTVFSHGYSFPPTIFTKRQTPER
jgi:hypothetical protein